MMCPEMANALVFITAIIGATVVTVAAMYFLFRGL